MVSIDCALSHPEASGLMGSRFHDLKGKANSLDSEALSLFGQRIFEQAKRVSINQMAVEAELVAEGARQLSQQIGSPEQQRAIIRAMDDETALALCRWIIEPGCMAVFIARNNQQQRGKGLQGFNYR